MTVCRSFLLSPTNGTPVGAMIRRFCFRAMLACVVCASSMLMQPHQARAMQATATAATDPTASSLEAVANCIPGNMCKKLGIRAFAAGGSPCPSPGAHLGTSVIPLDTTPPGALPEGASLSFSVEPVGGSPDGPSIAASLLLDPQDLLTVDYTRPDAVDLSTDQNVLYLSFDLITPVPDGVPLIATYFEPLGDHQFNQVAFACNGSAVDCTGVPQIRGLDVSIGAIPEPPSMMILAFAVATFGFVSTRRSR
jgi:hypothetical protein